jgi:hypothetical protein
MGPMLLQETLTLSEPTAGAAARREKLICEWNYLPIRATHKIPFRMSWRSMSCAARAGKAEYNIIKSFVAGTLRELSVGLCRGNFLMYRASGGRLPGLAVEDSGPGWLCPRMKP